MRETAHKELTGPEISGSDEGQGEQRGAEGWRVPGQRRETVKRAADQQQQ